MPGFSSHSVENCDNRTISDEELVSQFEELVATLARGKNPRVESLKKTIRHKILERMKEHKT